jgi:hypothetical protein
MWTCNKCGRIFAKISQPHSCQIIPLSDHFQNKSQTKVLFDHLLQRINAEIGKSKVISLPCCVHLYGKYDYLAALPKKDKLEIRFALDHKIENPRLKTCVQMSAKIFKNCFDINKIEQIDQELIQWIKQSYNLKN